MQEDRLLKVGMVASLTGQFRSQGSQALEGATAWAGDANAGGGVFVRSAGKSLLVRLQHYDDESKAQVARALTEKLILEDRVDLLLGPYSSVLTLAVAPVAERFRRVLWNHGGASDEIYARGFRWTVGILTPASRYLLGVIDLVRERDPLARKVAVLRSNRGSFPLAVASGVESYALEKGFRVVLNRQYPPGTADFSPLLRELEQSRPDIIIGVGRIQDDLTLARQMVDWPIKAKTIALVAAGIGQFKEVLGHHAAGFVGPSQWEPEAAYVPDYGPSPQELVGRLGKFGREGGDYALAQAYASGLVARKCVEEAGTLDNGTLREVAGRLDFTTFYGRFRLDPATGNQIGRSVLIVQWQDGEKVILWPKEMRQGDMIYPSHTLSRI